MAKKQAKKKAPAARKTASKMTLLDAAHKILSRTKKPMSCHELVAAAISNGYWKHAAGKTPAATLHASIGREIKTKKGASRFIKTGRGLFGPA